MKFLNGKELADYIKERQAKQVRNLRQEWGVAPKLAIIQTIDDPVIDTYVHLKQHYGDDILVEVEIHKVDQADLFSTIETLNADGHVHGMIIQLPLADTTVTDKAVNAVAVRKDVDGLADESPFTPATPMAIDWLLAGYNIDLVGKKIAIVGNGRLVGAPLSRLWTAQGKHVTVFDRASADHLGAKLRKFDVIITAVGKPGLIDTNDVKIGAVVIDAATSSENGKIVGDLSEAVRERNDLTLTPEKGGVGPLTVTALFDNVISAAREQAHKLKTS
jgi:methylenetetrahydrofolate dehydrogenase (NADP+)/methenyltetrahydrofolate cyclohydrolase